MKFLKRFKELNESEKLGKDLLFVYTTCDETYGAITWMVSKEFPTPELLDYDPCNFSTEDYIISEDDDNREKEAEILAKQTGGVWDDNYDYDEYEDEVVAWKEQTIGEWIEKYMGSDLWGSIYLLVGENLKDNWEEKTTDMGKYDRMPTKKELENDELTLQEGVEAWIDLSGVNELDNAEQIASAFATRFAESPIEISKILSAMKKSKREKVMDELEKNPEVDTQVIRSIMKAEGIGLF